MVQNNKIETPAFVQKQQPKHEQRLHNRGQVIENQLLSSCRPFEKPISQFDPVSPPTFQQSVGYVGSKDTKWNNPSWMHEHKGSWSQAVDMHTKIRKMKGTITHFDARKHVSIVKTQHGAWTDVSVGTPPPDDYHTFWRHTGPGDLPWIPTECNVKNHFFIDKLAGHRETPRQTDTSRPMMLDKNLKCIPLVQKEYPTLASAQAPYRGSIHAKYIQPQARTKKRKVYGNTDPYGQHLWLAPKTNPASAGVWATNTRMMVVPKSSRRPATAC